MTNGRVALRFISPHPLPSRPHPPHKHRRRRRQQQRPPQRQRIAEGSGLVANHCTILHRWTMRSIHTTKRLYSIAASPPLKSTVRPAPTSPRPRRASLSLASAVGSPSASASTSGSSSNAVVGSPGSRSLYTNASGPLHYFDSAYPPPPPPPPSSRPNNPHIVSTSRLTAGEAQAQNVQGNAPGNGPNANNAQSPHSPHSQLSQQTSHGEGHGQTSGGQQAEGGSQPLLGSSSLMLSIGGPAPPPGSSPPDYSFHLTGPRSGLVADQAWRSRTSATEATDRQAGEGDRNSAASALNSQKIFQLDVGAYGIPKRGRQSGRTRHCSCSSCGEEDEIFATDALEEAVQVGEDAYFVREDALGVADGVGGWGSRTSSSRNATSMHSCSTCAVASTSSSGRHGHRGHKYLQRPRSSQPSPSALFARRLMHFCAREVAEARLPLNAPTFGTGSRERCPEPVSMRAKPSLKRTGVVPRASAFRRQKTVVPEHGNARPFSWPWEGVNEGDSTGLGIVPEEDSGASGLSTEHVITTEEELDPFVGTIDPVDVLERAYNKTIDAHRVRRRVRVVKERKSPRRWWAYGLGPGSNVSPQSSTDEDILPIDRDRLNESEWEWQESWEPLAAGSSTALLAILSGDRLRVAHLGDCVGWLVRAGEIVWRSEEMWWGVSAMYSNLHSFSDVYFILKFNYPVQLGPSSPSRPADARRYDLSVQADDILILASDGMSDNCWEEDVLDEVRRAVAAHLPLAKDSQGFPNGTAGADLLGRRTLAGMLSEALCSRARQVSMQSHGPRHADGRVGCLGKENERVDDAEELPFARRAREEGHSFRGGKSDGQLSFPLSNSL